MSFLGTLSTTLSYNGFTFNGTSRTRFVANPRYAPDGRTVAAVVYRLSVTSFITNEGGGVDVPYQIQNIRRLLTTPGKALRYVSKGFGSEGGDDFSINYDGDVTDVSWGPRPLSLELIPVGHNQTWYIAWDVEFAVPECYAARYTDFPMGLTYEVSYALNEQRLTARTYSGQLEIPLTHPIGDYYRTPDSADAYRDRLRVQVPVGFRRTTERYTLSADRKVLQFVVVDEQLPTHEALPYGCTMASGNFRISTGQGLVTTQVSVSATYQIKPGGDKRDAYRNFFALFYDRADFTQKKIDADKDAIQRMLEKPNAKAAARLVNNSGFPPINTALIPVSFEVDEGLYMNGLTMSLSASYYYARNFEAFLTDSGIWRPVPNTNWQQWAASMEDVHNNRGSANMRFNPANDIIIDLCGETQRIRPEPPPIEKRVITTEKDKVAQPGRQGLLDARVNVDVEMDPGTAILKTLPTSKPSINTLGAAGPRGSGGLPQTGNPLAGGRSAGGYARLENKIDPKVSGVSVQQRTQDGFTLSFSGWVLATWAALGVPGVVGLIGYKLIADGVQRNRKRYAGMIGTTPVYRTEWVHRYRAIPTEKDQAPPNVRPEQVSPKQALIGVTQFEDADSGRVFDLSTNIKK
jgi:hypothetical protein